MTVVTSAISHPNQESYPTPTIVKTLSYLFSSSIFPLFPLFLYIVKHLQTLFYQSSIQMKASIHIYSKSIIIHTKTGNTQDMMSLSLVSKSDVRIHTEAQSLTDWYTTSYSSCQVGQCAWVIGVIMWAASFTDDLLNWRRWQISEQAFFFFLSLCLARALSVFIDTRQREGQTEKS